MRLARNNIPIELDDDPTGTHLQFFEQIRDAETRCDFLLFPIDANFHECKIKNRIHKDHAKVAREYGFKLVPISYRTVAGQ
jgi:hypothetical protein